MKSIDKLISLAIRYKAETLAYTMAHIAIKAGTREYRRCQIVLVGPIMYVLDARL